MSQTHDLFSKQNRQARHEDLVEDPVYMLLRNRRMDELRREFEGATIRDGKVESKYGAFAKYHWAIHSTTYLQLQKEYEQK